MTHPDKFREQFTFHIELDIKQHFKNYSGYLCLVLKFLSWPNFIHAKREIKSAWNKMIFLNKHLMMPRNKIYSFSQLRTLLELR